MVSLRMRVLKEPFDIPFSDEEKEADEKNILLGAFFPNGGDLVGCCLLTSLSDRAVKLRQMAVDFFYPGYEVVRNQDRCIACRVCERQCANHVHQ